MLLTHEEAASLKADKELLRMARQAFGSNKGWKQAIWNAWMNGDYRTPGLKLLDGPLQDLRNRRGPSWLNKIRIGKDKS